jgi:hypothetical protein
LKLIYVNRYQSNVIIIIIICITQYRECLPSFGVESFVLQFAIQNLKIKIYRTIILSVVLDGCETWSLTLRKERRLRVFENRVLRRVSGPKRDEVTGEWRKLHSEELNDLYSLPNTVRIEKNEIGWACGAYGRGERCAQGVDGEARGKEAIGETQT